jgi:fumarate hydratase, class II
MASHRTESDTLGPVEVPAAALFGAQTMRAIENFPISGRRVPLAVIYALAEIKGAAAAAHAEAGRLPVELAEAIQQAAFEVQEGAWDEQFPVDIFQTGSGTSSNMNVNEVLANRAGQLLGDALGASRVHPNDHVNLAQSSNDVFPSALHIATARALHDQLLPALRGLAAICHVLADEHFACLKTGRTHLMDAMPIRFGQSFRGYAQQLDGAGERLEACLPELHQLALGGTAVGTGVNAPAGFSTMVCAALRPVGHTQFRPTARPFQAQSSVDALTAYSGNLRGLASSLAKITNDIRWMASGPLNGLNELQIPAVQPGSSIMPAKVNPVICESVLMVCTQVYGIDASVGFANSQGQFELNTMMPLVGALVLEATGSLAAACESLDQRCLAGCEPRPEASARVALNPILATALAPKIGYEAAAALAKEALRSGRSLRELALEQTELNAQQIDALLDPARLCGERGRNQGS